MKASKTHRSPPLFTHRRRLTSRQGEAESAPSGAPTGTGAADPQKPQQGDDQASKGADTLQFAARQLGVHYLKRYFLLVCYR